MHARDPRLVELVGHVAPQLDELLKPPAGAHVVMREHDQPIFAATADPAFVFIALSPGTTTAAHLLHEVGHWLDMLLGGSRIFLDDQGLPLPVFASCNGPRLSAWLRAVEASDAHADLTRVAQGREGEARDWARYLLQPHELWATTWAQWACDKLDIAAEHEDGMALFQSKVGSGAGVWSAQDFAPVAACIEGAIQ